MRLLTLAGFALVVTLKWIGMMLLYDALSLIVLHSFPPWDSAKFMVSGMLIGTILSELMILWRRRTKSKRSVPDRAA